MVPDPHTLLNQLEADKCVFTVIDLSNAFFSIPVHKDSQYWFAFTHEGNRYTYTRLPQGYAESPAIFSAEIQKVVSTAVLRHDSQIITYVDDILNSLNLTVSLWRRHTLSTSPFACSWVQGQEREITPKPDNKKQLLSFLGLCNYFFFLKEAQEQAPVSERHAWQKKRKKKKKKRSHWTKWPPIHRGETRPPKEPV